MVSYVSLVVAIALGVVGQITLKEGALRTPSFNSVSSLATNYFLIGGLVAYAVAAMFYIYAIRNVPISVAFPSVSISYFVVALFAHYIWDEPFGLWQILALILIGSGIYVLGRAS